jgi:hypothetical protein
MTSEVARRNNPPTVAKILEQQGHAVPALYTPNTDNQVQRYLDEIARDFGRPLKFTKEGTWVTADDGEPVAETVRFIVLANQTRIGWIKFNGEGQTPTMEGGLLYEGYQMPPREQMGDLDPSEWEIGLDGKPADPWLHQIDVVLQNEETAEMFHFAARTKTSRRAVAITLRHYDRIARAYPGALPLVVLRVGGYQHSEKRVGWVKTPVLQVVGRVAGEQAMRPGNGAADEFGDSVPF